LLALISEKAASIEKFESVPRPSALPDLMSALKAAVEEARRKKEQSAGTTKPPRTLRFNSRCEGERLRLLTHVFCSAYRPNKDDQIELIDPVPGIRVTEATQKRLKRDQLSLANIRLALHLGLVEGKDGPHRFDFALSVTPPPGMEGPPGDLAGGSVSFGWPKSVSYFATAIDLGELSLYIGTPIAEHDVRRSPVEYALKISLDGEPFTVVSIPILYDMP
jgi:hypothetical protein